MNSSVFRVVKNQNYTVMSNYHLRDKRLSLKAIGLLSLMLSLPEDWNYSLAGLAAITKDGIAAIRAALNELTECGYIRITQSRSANGRLGAMIYTIYESPLEAPDSVAETDGKSKNVNPVSPSDQPSVSPSCENRKAVAETETADETDSPVCDFPQAVSPHTVLPQAENPTQINKDILNTDLQNTDKSILSVSPAGTDSMREDELLTSLKGRIGYDRLTDRFPADTVNYILSLMAEVYRTDRRQIRIGGVLRSVKDIRAQLDRLDADQLCYVLDCYKEVTTPIRSLRAYLLTALYNAPLSFGEHRRKEQEQAELATAKAPAAGSFDTNEFFEAAVRRSFQRSDGGRSAP